jgi:crotonobetaine/carnitine-CoA ligase
MFTTGTTSLPKAVVWTHANVLWGARLNAMQQQLRADDVALLFLPLFHVVGLSWCFTSMLWAGGCTVLQPRFSASSYWNIANRHGATIGSHVLATLKIMHKQPVPKHTFRRWIYARHDPAQDAHFGVQLVSGWGMTEVLTQAIVVEPGWDAPAGVIGRPSAGINVRIVDDAGTQVRPGEFGALLIGGIRGLSIFKEYDANPAANAEAFDEHGYFRTGDRVQLREDGWIAFGDRIKDVIKVGGEGVSAAEIEAVLARAGGLAEVAVVARPHEVYGEVPVAFAVRADSTEPETTHTERLLAACRENLSPFKQPRAIAYLHDLPRVGFGKISKVRLREMARDLQIDPDKRRD